MTDLHYGMGEDEAVPEYDPRTNSWRRIRPVLIFSAYRMSTVFVT
jgi:hypothetical protein